MPVRFFTEFSPPFWRRPAPRHFSAPLSDSPSPNRPDHSGDVRRHRRGNERPLHRAQRATGLAAISAQAGPVDGARETIHGLSFARHSSVLALRHRRATRLRSADLGLLFSSRRQHCLLDERRLSRAHRIKHDAYCRAPAHACARNRQRLSILSEQNFNPQPSQNPPAVFKQRVEAELAQGHPVFVDFTAAWCITCKFNEKTVLESADVREAFHGTASRNWWPIGPTAIPRSQNYCNNLAARVSHFMCFIPANPQNRLCFRNCSPKVSILEKLETISRTIASQ